MSLPIRAPSADEDSSQAGDLASRPMTGGPKAHGTGCAIQPCGVPLTPRKDHPYLTPDSQSPLSMVFKRSDISTFNTFHITVSNTKLIARCAPSDGVLPAADVQATDLHSHFSYHTLRSRQYIFRHTSGMPSAARKKKASTQPF